MIFFDANIFMRLLVEPQTPEQFEMMNQAARLMRSIRDGTVSATTSDAVLAEVAYCLRGAEYRMSIEFVVSALTRLVSLSGFVSPFKAVWLKALEIWLEKPGLGFVDSLACAYALIQSIELATFDEKLSKYPGLNVSSPLQW